MHRSAKPGSSFAKATEGKDGGSTRLSGAKEPAIPRSGRAIRHRPVSFKFFYIENIFDRLSVTQKAEKDQ